MKSFTEFRAKFRVSLDGIHECSKSYHYVLATVGFHPRSSNVMPRRYLGHGILDLFTADSSER